MLTIILVIFLVGYLLIALEHPLKINKAASALLTGTLLWIVYMGIAPDLPFAVEGTAFQSFIQSPGNTLFAFGRTNEEIHFVASNR